MEQIVTGQKNARKLDTEASKLIEIKRTFKAPLPQVWEAMTTADGVMQWWGPETYTAPYVKMDFRVGGQYLYAMRGPDGNDMWSMGRIEEIDPQKSFVYTDQFADEDGNPISPSEVGMGGNWPELCYVTVEFKERGEEETEIVLSHQGIPREMYDDCIAGWSSSLDKLQRYVEHRN